MVLSRFHVPSTSSFGVKILLSRFVAQHTVALDVETELVAQTTREMRLATRDFSTRVGKRNSQTEQVIGSSNWLGCEKLFYMCSIFFLSSAVLGCLGVPFLSKKRIC